MPRVLERGDHDVLGELGRGLSALFRSDDALPVLVEERLHLEAEVILGKRRVVVPLAAGEAEHLALVFLQEAHRVVFRVSLEEDDPEPIPADREVDSGLLALGEHVEPGRLELIPEDLVEARMRHVEARVDVRDQGVRAVEDPVRVHPPALRGKRAALLAVTELKHRVRREARAEDRSDILDGPVDHLDERLPECLLREVRTRHVGPGDHERI